MLLFVFSKSNARQPAAAEHAFWALASAVDILGIESYYAPGMVLLRADMQVLAVLLEQNVPKVSQLFKAHGVELTSICSEWCITWFAKSLPTMTMMRVWDVLFFEGFK
eukprot:3907915-Amphidinium_carterae.1